MPKKQLTKKRWVVKAGSNLIVSGGPLLIRSWMQQVEELKRIYNIEIIWVTSGAIATATEHLATKTNLKTSKLLDRTKSLSDKQALSAIGQPLIMDLYNLGLHTFSLIAAQILLTYDDLTNKARKKNFQNTIEKLLEMQAIPILNENDAVATQEIKFGDNDSLSAKVAAATRADRLIILTDVEGLFDSDPNFNKKAQIISEVSIINAKLLKLSKPTSASKRGTGGMYSKVLAAKEATKNKIPTYLVRGNRPSVLIDLAKNIRIGTYFKATNKAKS